MPDDDDDDDDGDDDDDYGLLLIIKMYTRQIHRYMETSMYLRRRQADRLGRGH